MDNKKAKRYYKVGETVWVVGKKAEGQVVKIDKKKLDVVVELAGEQLTLKVWEIDKLKYKRAEELNTRPAITFASVKPPTVYFAKVRPDATIPSKRLEDAGYDLYASVPSKEVDGKMIKEIFLPVHRTTLVPTGIAMALPYTHYFNTKHERGSTGKISMSVLAGVVDSGYRGELFLAITPLYKDILITSEVTEVQEFDNGILYPYSKAISQGTIELVPQVHIEEITYEDLQNIKSERGTTKLGQSGK